MVKRTVGLVMVALALSSIWSCMAPAHRSTGRPAVVYISDFGQRDGAVSSMKGVARGVEPELVLEDLSHRIKPFDIWEAAYRLRQTAGYWPSGTVFVCVIDPGVGSARRSVVARTESGQLFVTPDNGTLTLIAESDPIVELREISAAHRVPGSERSATFHGRDVYSLTGALLASGQLSFEQVGDALDPASLVRLDHPRHVVEITEEHGEVHRGMLPVLDSNFGNVWTNLSTLRISEALEGSQLRVMIEHDGQQVFEGVLPFVSSFGQVPLGESLAYSNSLGELAFALNQGSFAERFGISAGPGWTVSVRVGQ